jgi:hypothetical protein
MFDECHRRDKRLPRGRVLLDVKRQHDPAAPSAHTERPSTLAEVVPFLEQFLLPIARACERGESFEQRSLPGGPWTTESKFRTAASDKKWRFDRTDSNSRFASEAAVLRYPIQHDYREGLLAIRVTPPCRVAP